MMLLLEKTLDYLKMLFLVEDANKKRNNKIKKILTQLDNKAEALNLELQNEKNERTKKNIELMLKVIAKQQQKGEKIIKNSKAYESRREPVITKVKLSPQI